MKYLVNRETKEHVAATETMSWSEDHWRVIEADSEGWIKHDGGECPLPDKGWVQVQHIDGERRNYYYPQVLSWNYKGLHRAKFPVAYRPILDSKPDIDQALDMCAEQAVSEFNTGDLLSRLKSAHQSAAELPDIVAELRAQLEPLGYDLVARDPFVAQDEQPTEDMSDWRNWRQGDQIKCVDNKGVEDELSMGFVYTMIAREKSVWVRLVYNDQLAHGSAHVYNRFRFHSRPTKGAKS